MHFSLGLVRVAMIMLGRRYEPFVATLRLDMHVSVSRADRWGRKNGFELSGH